MTFAVLRYHIPISGQICSRCIKVIGSYVGRHPRSFSKVSIPEPEFDWEYLGDSKNHAEIQKNIVNRKGVGNIKELEGVLGNISSLKKSNESTSELWKKAKELAAEIPNRTHPLSPIGDEDENETIASGIINPRPKFDFKPHNILELGSYLDGLRVDNVGHVCGPRSYYFMNDFARLEQALVSYTVSRLKKHGFSLLSVPDMLNPQVIEGCGFKANDHQVYKVSVPGDDDVCLSGTGEIGLAGYLMNKRLTQEEMPCRLMTVSRCFRAEASEAQSDMGIYRVHQFTKVEMFVLVANEMNASEQMFEEMVAIQTNMFKDLGIHFRILNMSSGELGAPAYRKFDMEALMPAHVDEGYWGEISSTSNCTDYQSRRLNIKYTDGGGNLKHVHTLNGTACAVPRMMIALLETHQKKEPGRRGAVSVTLPVALQPFMQGQEKIVAQKPLKMKWTRRQKSYSARNMP